MPQKDLRLAAKTQEGKLVKECEALKIVLLLEEPQDKQLTPQSPSLETRRV